MVLSAILAVALAIATVKEYRYPPTVAICLYEHDALSKKEVARAVLLEFSQIMKQDMICESETANYIYKVFVGILGRHTGEPYFHYSVVEIRKDNSDYLFI